MKTLLFATALLVGQGDEVDQSWTDAVRSEFIGLAALSSRLRELDPSHEQYAYFSRMVKRSSDSLAGTLVRFSKNYPHTPLGRFVRVGVCP